MIIGRNEISDMAFPGVVAVDKSESGDGVILTVAPKKVQTSGGGGGGGESEDEKTTEEQPMRGEGNTVFEANRMITAKAHKDIHWGHNEYIIVGEEAAKDDILKYLDFFIRNHETIFHINILVAKNSTGKELIEKLQKSPVSITESITNIYRNRGPLSYFSEMLLSELSYCLSSRYTSAIIPAINISKQEQEDDGKSSGQEQLSIDSIAVFKEHKLIGYLSGNEARVVNWLKNKIRAAVISVDDNQGFPVSVDVIDSKAKIKTKIKDENPSIKIILRFTTNIVELQGEGDVFNEEQLRILEQQQTEYVKEEIKRVIEQTRLNGTDIFGFGEAFYRSNPVKWEKIKDRWEEIYRNLNIEYDVRSIINRSYNVENQIGTKKIRKKNASY